MQLSSSDFIIKQLMPFIWDALRITYYFEILMVMTLILEMIFQLRSVPLTALTEVSESLSL